MFTQMLDNVNMFNEVTQSEGKRVINNSFMSSGSNPLKHPQMTNNQEIREPQRSEVQA